MRALGLLDVDGPLNPTDGKPTRRPHGYTTHRLRPVGFEHAKNPLRVWLAPEHGPMLRRWAERLDVELVWATTWEHDANRMIGPVIGLPELPVIEFGQHPGTIEGWKYPAVAAYAAGRPLLWFDDDFRARRLQEAQAAFLEARKGVPTLLHHVDPRIGLNVLDLNVAERWLDKEVPRG